MATLQEERLVGNQRFRREINHRVFGDGGNHSEKRMIFAAIIMTYGQDLAYIDGIKSIIACDQRTNDNETQVYVNYEKKTCKGLIAIE